ncbi:MAG: DUF4395 family protein [Vicinamibacterales bacterium]
MPRVTCEMRARVEMQGFVGLSDEAISDIVYWLRLAPFVCAAWTVVGLWQASALVIWALAPFAALGAVLPRHPFDVLYMRVIRPWRGSAPIPEYGAPRRSACVVATVWLTATGACLAAGAVTAGRALGLVFVAIASVQVATGFCIPSWVYGRVSGWRPTGVALGERRPDL